MRKSLLALGLVTALAGCETPPPTLTYTVPPLGFYNQLPASPPRLSPPTHWTQSVYELRPELRQPPVAAPVNLNPPDNDGDNDAATPRHHYWQPPVTAQPDKPDEPSVDDLLRRMTSPPEPPPVIARPEPPAPPSTGFFSGPAGCAGRWWDLCHVL